MRSKGNGGSGPSNLTLSAFDFEGVTPFMRETAAAKGEAKSGSEDVVRTFLTSIDRGKRSDRPYRNWLLMNCFPADTVDDILALPFEAPSLDGISGKRELHNNTRKYFDADNRKSFPVCQAVSEALQ